MVTYVQGEKDAYGGGGYVGRQQMICGATTMEKWVVRTATYWANINRELLPT